MKYQINFIQVLKIRGLIQKTCKNLKIFLAKILGYIRLMFTKRWRSGRAVEGGGLENRFRESERGFESYLLRQGNEK